MKTAQNTIRETSVYTCFVYNSEQRPINAGHVKDIMSSMSTFGFLPSKPVQVYQDGKKFVIIDGHHRYIAAKNLQIPVLYVVEPKSHQESIASGNRFQNKWTATNYVNMYANRGLDPYKELKEYHALGIPFAVAASLLSGLSATGKNSASGSVYDGALKIKTREKIEQIAQFLRDHGGDNKSYKTQNFIVAVELCMRVPDFSFSQLAGKLSNNPRLMVRTATADQMLEQIEEIYNSRQRVPVNIAFLARAAKKHNGSAKKIPAAPTA